jgi:hypothetical protein
LEDENIKDEDIKDEIIEDPGEDATFIEPAYIIEVL